MASSDSLSDLTFESRHSMLAMNFREITNNVTEGNNDMNEVIPGLFLGNMNAALNVEQLKQHGISHVLNVRSKVDWVAMVHYEENNIEFAHVLMQDSPSFDMKKSINAAIAFIQVALDVGGRVLVYCNAGISRSPTVVVAYIMANQDVDAICASQLVKNRHNKALPNHSFIRFLCEWEDILKKRQQNKKQDIML